MTLLLAALLLVAGGSPDVSRDVLLEVGDRFDQAQIGQDRAALEAMVASDLVFVGSDGARQGRAEFIAGWMDPNVRFDPVTITSRYALPLGPESGVVGGEAVLRGTAAGSPFTSRIRFSDTFRLIDGQWRAVHIQATRVPEPAAQ